MAALPSAFAQLPAAASDKIKPYRVNVPQLKVRGMEILVQTCPIGPETYENSQPDGDRKFGAQRAWLTEAKRRWTEDFKWEEHQKKLNELPHFTAAITDDNGATYDVHFMALFSTNPDAIPVALFHGWPGSFLEFRGLFREFQDRYDNDAAKLPYHLIAPSLIGFGLSSKPPKDRNWQVGDTARIMHKMLLQLGFGTTGYVAQGGDIGSMVSQRMAQEFEECRAIHLNFLPMFEAPDKTPLDMSHLSKYEVAAFDNVQTWLSARNAYAREHATRPATIGLVLSSSPIALLAWIGEKFLEWTDTDPDIDEILLSVSLYWLTECYPTSIYTYRDPNTLKSSYPTKPLGFSWFPHEIIPTPRIWIEQKTKDVWFRAHESGGHFAALEKPRELAQDIEDFLAVTWPKVRRAGGVGGGGPIVPAQL